MQALGLSAPTRLALVAAICVVSLGCSDDDETRPDGATSDMDAAMRDAAARDAGPETGMATCGDGVLGPPVLPSVTSSHEVDAGLALANGPIVGAITDTSCRLWIRTTMAARWRVALWPVDAPESVAYFEGSDLVREHDFTGVSELTGLLPSTRYAYRVVWLTDDADAGTDAGTEGSFHTLGPRHAPGHVRFAVGADLTGTRSQPIFQDLRDTEPDFVLLIGDQVYADTRPPTYEGYAFKYAANWNIEQLRELMTHVPTLMMWDDHDIIDNYFAGSSPRYEPARLAYEIFAHAHNPAAARPGALYYSFQAGDVSFFVLDVRSHRSDSTIPDAETKTMLGADQLDALFEWLLCRTARVKVLVSPVPFSDWADSDDAWKGYATERDRIFAFIAEHDVDDVLLISGDQHWSAVFVEQRHGHQFVELLPTPLSKSRRTGPVAPTSAIVARDDDHFVFGVVDIDTRTEPAQIDLTLCAEGLPCIAGQEPDPGSALDQPPEADNVPFTLHFTTNDLGAR